MEHQLPISSRVDFTPEWKEVSGQLEKLQSLTNNPELVWTLRNALVLTADMARCGAIDAERAGERFEDTAKELEKAFSIYGDVVLGEFDVTINSAKRIAMKVTYAHRLSSRTHANLQKVFREKYSELRAE